MIFNEQFVAWKAMVIIMKLKTFTIPYLTDERLEYAKEYLVDNGYSYVEDVASADFVIL